MLYITNTISPHNSGKILHYGAELSSAEKAMIMIHGRGADAQSIISLYEHFKAEKIIYIAPQAADNTWYPYRFIEKREANEPGITSGLRLIKSIIDTLNDSGIATENIFLLGFSQGACLAADYAARYTQRFAAVFCLSGALIGDTLDPAEYNGDMQQTPVFFGCSENDFHIPEQRIHESARIFTSLNARVTERIYPNLGHTINRDELAFIKDFM